MTEASETTPIAYADFERVDIRVGTIIRVDPFPEARKPAWKLAIDFGPELGVKTSSAQITDLYDASALRGKQVCAAVNFPPRRIGPFLSEVLTLGLANAAQHVVLVSPDQNVPNGQRLF